MRTVTVGIVVPDSQASAALRSQIRATGFGTVTVETSEYPRSRADGASRKFMDARPDLVLIAAEHPSVAEECVRALRAALPSAWIMVCTSTTDERIRMELIRSGAYQLLPAPVTQESLAQALRQVHLLHEVIEARERERKGESLAKGALYAVCAGKRGAGATTIAINVAASLAEAPNAKVALIDLDWPIGDVAAYLNIASRFTVSDALSSADRLDSVLLESYMYKHERIHVLPGFEEFEPGKTLSVAALNQLLELVMQSYTHTVIDLSFFLDPQLVETVTRMSSAVLAVITPELPSLRRTERLLRFVGEGAAADKIRLVLNRATKTDEITERDIQKALHHPVSWKVTNDYRLCKQAINAGKTLLSTKYLGRDFREMARQLMGAEPEGPRKGLLNLLAKPSSLL